MSGIGIKWPLGFRCVCVTVWDRFCFWVTKTNLFFIPFPSQPHFHPGTMYSSDTIKYFPSVKQWMYYSRLCFSSGAEKRAGSFLVFLHIKKKIHILDTQTSVSSNIKKNHKINHRRGIKATSGTFSQRCCLQILEWKGWFLSEMIMRNQSPVWKKMENFWRELDSLKQESGFWPLEFSQKLE